MFNRLYFVRHGESRNNITKEFSYKLIDYSLTPMGIVQAQQTAKYFEYKSIHEIYSSPLKRAIETAGIIACQLELEVKIVEDLREINVGLLESSPPTSEAWELHENIIESWYKGRKELAFPDGENYTQVWERMQKTIRNIVANKVNHNIIIVAHGGLFNTTLINLCQNAHTNTLCKLPHSNCSITEIEVFLQGEEMVTSLVYWGFNNHLSFKT